MKYLCYDSALNEEYTLIQLQQRYPQYISLFAGTDDEGIWDAAPWLFGLNNNVYDLKDHPYIKLEHSVIFESKETLKDILEYLQSKIYQKQNGQQFYFRIWDPRVLLKHLSTWGTTEIKDFFMLFEAFYTESNEEDFLNKWEWKGGVKIEAVKIRKSEALPVIKSEEELDKEFEELHKPKAEVKDEKPEAREKQVQTGEVKQDEEKPARRKFFMD